MNFLLGHHIFPFAVHVRWVKEWHRECVKRSQFWKSSPRSPLHLLWGVLSVSVYVCHYSHIPQNKLFPMKFWTFPSLPMSNHTCNLQAPSFQISLKVALLVHCWDGYAVFWPLSSGLDQWPIWVIMQEDAPWFAKRFCFMRWTSFSPLWFCFLSAVVPH